MEIRGIDAKQTHELRQAVLRPHQTLDEMVYPGDALDGAFHLGALDAQAIVGVVSLSPEPYPSRAGSWAGRGGWRLRGMAVASAKQGRGIGGALVAEATRRVLALDGEAIWFNARVSARSFYAAHGFVDASEVFALPHIGPHVVMHRRLGRGEG